MERPLGVSLVAFAMYAVTGILLVFSYFCFAAGPAMGQLGQTPGLPLFRYLGASAVGAIVLFVAIVSALAGSGLWSLRAWGRVLTILLLAITAALCTIGIAVAIIYPRTWLAIERTIALGVNLMVLRYLAKLQVRQGFNNRQ